MSDSARQRGMAYVDGFNLYFGLRESGYRRYYWLNVKRLIENLLRPDQELVITKYFTARIPATTSAQTDEARRSCASAASVVDVRPCDF